MAYPAVRQLKTRHHEIIRRSFLGQTGVDIAAAMGLSTGAVYCVLASELARAELARLQAQAEDKVADTPMRVKMETELNAAGMEAIRVNRSLMNSGEVDPRVRSTIGKHFMDRIVFQTHDNEQEGSYRDILRKLDEIERGVRLSSEGAILLPPGSVQVMGHDPTD